MRKTLLLTSLFLFTFVALSSDAFAHDPRYRRGYRNPRIGAYYYTPRRSVSFYYGPSYRSYYRSPYSVRSYGVYGGGVHYAPRTYSYGSYCW